MYFELLNTQLYELTPANQGYRGVETTENKSVGFGRNKNNF